MIRRTFSNQDDGGLTEEDIIHNLTFSRLLILDELGVGRKRMSPWEQGILDYAFEHRYDRKGALLILSNLPADELMNYLGPRIASRFSERGKVLEFDWEDYRASHQKGWKDL